jgi:hypothetical protein
VAHQALVDFIESLKDSQCPSEIKQELLDVIKQNGLEFGQPPFHTEEDAKEFFATMFGQQTYQSNAGASMAYFHSTKHMGTWCLWYCCVTKKDIQVLHLVADPERSPGEKPVERFPSCMYKA